MSSNNNDESLLKKWRSLFTLPIKEQRKQIKSLDLSETTTLNQNILHIACLDTQIQSIEILLSFTQKNLNINLQDSIKGWTPIFYLIDSSDGSETEILQSLIKSGSDINIKDNYGITLLHLVSFKGQDEYLSILLQNNVDMNAKDKLNRCAINYAIMEGQLNSAYLLLEAGCELNFVDIDGNSLLHYAVSSKGNALLFSIMLIDRKINLNIQNLDGDTALMLVAKNNPKENVRLLRKLLSSGAKYKNIINYNCQSFLSLMGEAAIKDQFISKNNYKNLDVDKENKKSMEKMEDYIKNNSGSMEFGKGKSIMSFIIPLIILFISIVVGNINK